MMTQSEIDSYIESKKNVEILYQLIYDFLQENDVLVWDLVGCLEQIKNDELNAED